MIDIPRISQNDKRWKNIQHGTGNTTIGQTGCALCSAVAVLNYMTKQNLTPPEVNSWLVKRGGYSQGNLIIWSKLVELYRVNGIKRVRNYNNVEVAFNVYVLKRPVIVEVYNSKAIGLRHFVVYLGDRQLMDVANGMIYPTSKYPTQLGYVIYS